MDRAIKLCNAEQHAALPRIVKSGLTRANKGEQEITNAVEEMVLEMTPLISKRMAWLPTLASLATMLGLLGTIIGMIEAFAAVAKAFGPKQEMLAGAIAIAMNTTAFGLMVVDDVLELDPQHLGQEDHGRDRSVQHQARQHAGPSWSGWYQPAEPVTRSPQAGVRCAARASALVV